MANITRQDLIAECGGSEETLKAIEAELCNEPYIKAICVSIDRLKKQGLIVQAMQRQQELMAKELHIIRRFKEENLKRAEKVQVASLSLTPEENEKMAKLCVSIAICADLVESYSMDIDSIIKRHEPETNFMTFQPFRDCLSKARETLKWLRENTDLYQYESWGNHCDDLQDMVKNKAGKLLRQSVDRKRKTQNKK